MEINSEAMELTITNESEKSTGQLIITKRSKDNQDVLLANAIFAIENAEGEVVLENLKTNDLGEVIVDILLNIEKDENGKEPEKEPEKEPVDKEEQIPPIKETTPKDPAEKTPTNKLESITTIPNTDSITEPEKIVRHPILPRTVMQVESYYYYVGILFIFIGGWLVKRRVRKNNLINDGEAEIIFQMISAFL